jgi:hypothetical protein
VVEPWLSRKMRPMACGRALAQQKDVAHGLWWISFLYT